MSGVGAGDVHVGGRLLQPAFDGALAAAPEQLALDHESVGPSRPARPHDEQVHPAAPEGILSLDPPRRVHDPVQKRLQHELRPGLGVLRPLDPVLGVLAEELLERRQQRVEIEMSIRVNVR